MSELVQRFGLKTVLSVGGMCAVGVTAWIIYYFTDDSDDDEFKRHKTSRNVVIKVEVNKENIGMIIGRNGSNLKYIEKQTDTRINVDDENDENSTIRTLTIRGSSDSVQNAESLVYSQINNQPVIEVKEIFIPTSAVGRVIGKVGTSIKEIIKKSNAKVEVDSNRTDSVRSETTKVTIRGTVEQISTAVELINKKVEEYQEVKAKMDEGLSKRSPFRSLKNQTANHNQQPDNSLEPLSVQEGEAKAERLISTSSDGSLTVFMSAVTNPDRFWVQIMNDRAVELDQLVETMTEYYNQKPNQETHRLTEITPGQIVSVLFHVDQRWYRAQVVSISSSSSPPTVELYFVDYGDSVDVPQPSVFGLDPRFLSLRFQAIECSLAHILPVGDSWSEEAITCFEDLTHVAQWKPMVARVESYKDKTCNSRSGSPLPCVSLFDTSGDKDVNISQELISRGFAVSGKTATENGNSNGDSTATNGNGSSDSDTVVTVVDGIAGGVVGGVSHTLLTGSLPIPNVSPNRSIGGGDRPHSVASSYASSVASSATAGSKNKRDSTSSGENKGEKKKRKF
uniref:Tudor and KH domain-containing protein n=1 Tax=Cacopsylla melanoneura TaxID=428564 RepID=A0A8D8Q077_9HEMI